MSFTLSTPPSLALRVCLRRRPFGSPAFASESSPALSLLSTSSSLPILLPPFPSSAPPRRHYNTKVTMENMVFPKTIILVRHGESKGNVSDKAYVSTPDWLIPLSKTGEAQSAVLGIRLKSTIIKDDPVYFYTSPYLRAKQTLAMTIQKFDSSQVIGLREEPRLTEQQFGNFQDVIAVRNAKIERHKYGRFYYRFPLGESGLDVYNRASSFINTLFRDFQDREVVKSSDTHLVLVTHGLTMRLLLMRFFQYTVADFERSQNAGNCGVVVMERNDDEDNFVDGRRKQLYRLTEDSRQLIQFPEKIGAGHTITAESLIKEVSREGLGSFADPSDHIKYWTDVGRGEAITGPRFR